jgi:hypothetical protein
MDISKQIPAHESGQPLFALMNYNQNLAFDLIFAHYFLLQPLNVYKNISENG